MRRSCPVLILEGGSEEYYREPLRARSFWVFSTFVYGEGCVDDSVMRHLLVCVLVWRFL